MAWSQIMTGDSLRRYKRTLLGLDKKNNLRYFPCIPWIKSLFSCSPYHEDLLVCNQFISHLPMEGDLHSFSFEIYHQFMLSSYQIATLFIGRLNSDIILLVFRSVTRNKAAFRYLLWPVWENAFKTSFVWLRATKQVWNP